jgi:hypothetical protein
MNGISLNTGLKYTSWDFVFSLDAPNKFVPVTVSFTGNNQGVYYVVGDGVNLNKIGEISYLKTWDANQGVFNIGNYISYNLALFFSFKEINVIQGRRVCRSSDPQ